ncbi:unique cartilage matrix-associated protein isoform X1 [Mirounga leonina]|uniref:unique cartilage matrix-associated protein isoform X1 n=1 Tax=Mirounga leonina TaxID=9715 RepID=UPI00156BFBD3|nr:unique cartilage matrix-associated protein isoform X1 [Mirounga leonina]
MASCLSAAVLLTMLQEGTGASVGTQQMAGQEAQEGECEGHPGVQGRWDSYCGNPGEPGLVVTGLSRVSDVEQKIFMQELDASNFLKKRGKRSPKSRDEASGKDAGGLPLPFLSHSQLGCGDCWGIKEGST